MEKIRIAIVDDQKIFRQSLGALISSNPEFELCDEFNSGEGMLVKLETDIFLPHLAILDMEMPGMNGQELCITLHKKYPSIKTIILSVHANERVIAKMIEAGACGYLVKNCDKTELFTAITSVYKTGFYIDQQVLQAIQRSATHKNKPVYNQNKILVDISARELEVLQLICIELNSAEIAQKLFISSRTAEGHRNSLLLKTGCRNVAGLVLFAVKNGLFDLDTLF